jgi:hypothetical protein
MRTRVASRIISLGCLVALLCLLLPFSAPSATARPIGPDPWGDNPTPPTGDTDGVVLTKSFARGGVTVAATADQATMITVRQRGGLWSSLWTVYHHGGLRAVMSILHLGNWWLGLR